MGRWGREREVTLGCSLQIQPVQLKSDSFWAKANEESLASQDFFQDIERTFATGRGECFSLLLPLFLPPPPSMLSFLIPSPSLSPSLPFPPLPPSLPPSPSPLSLPPLSPSPSPPNSKRRYGDGPTESSIPCSESQTAKGFGCQVSSKHL